MAGQLPLTGLALVTGLLGTFTSTSDCPAMDASRKDVVVRLKWIGSVREGEKLDTRNMTVQPMSMLTSVARCMKGLNRNQTRVFLATTIDQAVRIVGDDINHIMHASDIPAIERLLSDLESAIRAIPFIKQTYNEDRTFNCALDELTETTTQHLINFRHLMQQRSSV